MSKKIAFDTLFDTVSQKQRNKQNIYNWISVLKKLQGNPLYLFQNTNPIIFVMFIPLFFDLLYQRGFQWQYFWSLHLKVLAYEADTA